MPCTYTAPDGGQRIGSRSADGDHHLTDEGVSAGHGLPLTVTGKPACAVRAYLVHRAPNGRRLTATAPEVFGTVFDTRDSSGPLTRASARGAALLSGCAGVFRAMDARTGRAVGVVGPQDGTVGEGIVVSADGNRFIVCVHPPDAQQNGNDYGCEDPDFRSVPIAAGGTSTPVADPFLDRRTMFVSWS
ncbi:hypothetical protein [Streptomyces olivaceoviridis]